MESERQTKIWRALGLLSPVLKRYFRVDLEPLPTGVPSMVICNHVTNLDPVFLFLASPEEVLAFVASDNILRNHPVLRGWIDRVFSPIYRRKGVSAVDTCRKAVGTLRDGRSVCLFAEGETTWNGLTGPIRPGTAALVRASGAGLVTYRMRGGYFSAPRWRKGFHRGRITGRITGTLSPEEVRAMDPKDLEDYIQRAIRDDAWQDPVTSRGSGRARQIDALLFLCPRCNALGGIRGDGDRIRCACGLDLPLDGRLLLPEGAPFRDLAEWDRWQISALGDLLRKDPGLVLREERQDLTLWEVAPDGTPKAVGTGGLSMDKDALRAAGMEFPLPEISDLALLQNRKMAVSCGGKYYELHAPRATCFRKYVFRLQAARERKE